MLYTNILYTNILYTNILYTNILYTNILYTQHAIYKHIIYKHIIYKHTIVKHTTYKMQNIKTKKKLEVLKEGKKTKCREGEGGREQLRMSHVTCMCVHKQFSVLYETLIP